MTIKGNEQPPHERPQAGMIFYNDEGSENGGLILAVAAMRKVKLSIQE